MGALNMIFIGDMQVHKHNSSFPKLDEQTHANNTMFNKPDPGNPLFINYYDIRPTSTRDARTNEDGRAASFLNVKLCGAVKLL